MNVDINKIHELVGGLKDQSLGLSLSSLNALKEVKSIDNDTIGITLELVGPAFTEQQRLSKEIKALLEPIGLKLELTVNELYPDNSNRQYLKKVKNIIAVASGKGGVGKSALAGNIAASLMKLGYSTGILDADVYGPSQPTMFGLKDAKLEADTDEHGKTTAIPVDRDGLKIASMGFVLNRDEAAIVRGPMLASYFSLLFEQIEWGELDFLVFDLPPGTGDIQLTLVQKIPLNGAVIVTTPQEIALADVRRSIAMFRKVNVDILGIVENMSYFTPEDAPDKKYYIFGKDGGKIIAYESQVELLGQIPLDIEMSEANDGGSPVALSGKSPAQVKIIRETTENIIKEVRKVNYSKISDSIEISI